MGKSAFDWDLYKNRKTVLQHLKRRATLVDTILETEDGSAHELVHSQVMSAFGDKLTKYMEENGRYIHRAHHDGYGLLRSIDHKSHQLLNHGHGEPILDSNCGINRINTIKLIRLPKLNRYTLSVLVECAYTGYIRTDLSSGGIWDVLDLAEHYEMLDVVRACCAFLIKNLDRSNCVHFYHIGIKHRHHLQRCAWLKIRANFKYLLYASNCNYNFNDLTAAASLMELEAGSNQQQIASGAAATTNQTTTSDKSHCDSEIRGHSTRGLALGPSGATAGGCNSLATINFEHFEPLLMHDRLNVDSEESVWHAIKCWCEYDLKERANRLARLLPCVRFARFKTGIEFTARSIWRDSLISNNRFAQHQLAILDRNHRDYMNNLRFPYRDGFNLPCALEPRQLRPRIPYSVMLAIGGWQQGQPTKLIESYDANCNLWFDCKKHIMTPLAYHGIECINNILYICGGTDGNEILNELFTFDPVRGSCQQKVSMHESRCYVSTAYLGNHLYALGGHNGLQRLRSVERFDVTNERWSHTSEMNVARSDASACVYNELIYIAGGLNDQIIESSVEFYNPADNTWSFVASMLTPRTSFTLLNYGKQLLAIGGNNGHERLNSVECYEAELNTWRQHSQMRNRRSTFSAAIVDESKVYVVGGYNGQTPFSQVEMLDLKAARQWVPVQKIHYDRSGLRVVVVNDLANADEYTFAGSQQSAGQQQPASGARSRPGNRLPAAHTL